MSYATVVAGVGLAALLVYWLERVVGGSSRGESVVAAATWTAAMALFLAIALSVD